MQIQQMHSSNQANDDDEDTKRVIEEIERLEKNLNFKLTSEQQRVVIKFHKKRKSMALIDLIGYADASYYNEDALDSLLSQIPL